MSVTFEEWIYAIFHHPASKPEWYWEEAFEALWERLTDAEMVRYMTRLFMEPELLQHYSHEQVAQGILFLIDDASPGEASAAIFREAVPLAERVACVEAMATFFRRFVAPAAPGPAEIESDPLHMACYMWWELFPMRFLMQDEEQVLEPALEQAALKVMAETLALPSELCQLSALHGLSYWHSRREARVEEIVESFLGGDEDVSPRVISSRVREYVLEKLT
jgi:hypothetical protein